MSGRHGVRAAFAVVLHFDEFSERRIRQAWAALDGIGIPSAAATYEADYRPHVTLAIVNTSDPGDVADRLRGPLADVAGMPLTLTSLGFFLTDKAPAYLAVTPTRRLLEAHDAVHAAIGTTESWSYYQPGNWMPHCTLAMEVPCQTTVAEALSDTALPIRAMVGSAHLTELPRRSIKSHRPGAHRRPTSVRKAASSLQRERVRSDSG